MNRIKIAGLWLALTGVGILSAILLTGCSTVGQKIKKEVSLATNGVITETYLIEIKGQTALQSQQTLDKSRASVTKTGASAGLAGLDQKSDMASAFEAAGGMLKDFASAFASAMSSYASGGLINTGGGGGTAPKPTNSVVPIEDQGFVATSTTIPTGTTIPVEFALPPAWHVIVSVKTISSGVKQICNAQGNCWRVVMSEVTRIPGTGGEVWTVGGLRFWVIASALA